MFSIIVRVRKVRFFILFFGMSHGAIAIACPDCEYQGFPGVCYIKSGCIAKTVAQLAEETLAAAEQAVRDADSAARKLVEESRLAQLRALEDARRVAENARKDAELAAKSIADANFKAAQNVMQAHLDALKTADETLITPTRKAVIDTANRAVSDIMRTVSKAFNDASVTADIAGKDIVAEGGRTAREVETAGKALVTYVEAISRNLPSEYERNFQRVREGKFVDAMWYAGLAPMQVSEQAAGEAVMQSAVLRTIGQVGATAYGGPGGAAAYAAWLAYRQTGNLEVAIRVGIISGASSLALGGLDGAGGVQSMSTASALEISKKAIVAGAIGGAAVAISGGNEQAIQMAFLQAGSMVLIKDGYREYTGHKLDGKIAEKDGYCMTSTTGCQSPPDGMTATSKEGQMTELHMRLADKSVNAVGDKLDTSMFSETKPYMKLVGTLPGGQSMAIFHDQWAFDTEMGRGMTITSILPAIVITYVGLGAPYYEDLRVTGVETWLRDAQQPLSSPTNTTGTTSANVTIAAKADTTSRTAFINHLQLKDVFMCFNGNKQRTVAFERLPDKIRSGCGNVDIMTVGDDNSAEDGAFTQTGIDSIPDFPAADKIVFSSSHNALFRYKNGYYEKVKPGYYPRGVCVRSVKNKHKNNSFPLEFTLEFRSADTNSNSACRLVVIENHITSVAAGNLIERDYCTSPGLALLHDMERDGWVCYKGDAGS